MNFSNKKINELIEYLQGSCDTLDEGVNVILGEEYSSEDLSKQNVEQIDNEIFLCSVCVWWFEVSEMSEEESESTCVECHND